MPCPMSRGREKGNGCGIRRRGNQPRFEVNADMGGNMGGETRLVRTLAVLGINASDYGRLRIRDK